MDFIAFIFSLENWSIEAMLTLLSIAITIIAGIFALKQWKTNVNTKRSEFIYQIIEKLRFDREMAEIVYMIEYSQGWYDENFHNNKDGLEFQIDKLLSYLEYICYNYKIGHITEKEFVILRYEINRVCSSPDIQEYLWNLYHFSSKHNMECAFHNLINYASDNNIIQKQFYNKENNNYHRYLNF